MEPIASATTGLPKPDHIAIPVAEDKSTGGVHSTTVATTTPHVTATQQTGNGLWGHICRVAPSVLETTGGLFTTAVGTAFRVVGTLDPSTSWYVIGPGIVIAAVGVIHVIKVSYYDRPVRDLNNAAQAIQDDGLALNEGANHLGGVALDVKAAADAVGLGNKATEAAILALQKTLAEKEAALNAAISKFEGVSAQLAELKNVQQGIALTGHAIAGDTHTVDVEEDKLAAELAEVKVIASGIHGDAGAMAGAVGPLTATTANIAAFTAKFSEVIAQLESTKAHMLQLQAANKALSDQLAISVSHETSLMAALKASDEKLVVAQGLIVAQTDQLKAMAEFAELIPQMSGKMPQIRAVLGIK